MKVYLDNGATTKVDEKVMNAMNPFFIDKYGNASSLHSLGRESKEALEKAREIIAKKLNASPEEIVFTSGGTESNNLAIKGAAFASKGKHIITSTVEHDCVLNACKWLETQGYEVTYLEVDKEGFVTPQQVKEAIREDTFLVTLIHGNNEIGTIIDIDAIGKVCREKGVIFHTDACQSFTKVPIDANNIDMITINGHKIHGPKGVGALYVRKGIKLNTWQHGGGQEFDKRSGTENVSGIVGLAESSKVITDAQIKEMERLRDKFIDAVLKEIPNTRLNGPRENRLCNNASISFEFIEGESIMMRLDDKGIAVSTGSACSSKSLDPSHVLLAIGLKHEIAHGTIRFTLSKYTTEEEIDYTIKVLKEEILALRKLSPLYKEE